MLVKDITRLFGSNGSGTKPQVEMVERIHGEQIDYRTRILELIMC